MFSPFVEMRPHNHPLPLLYKEEFFSTCLMLNLYFLNQRIIGPTPPTGYTYTAFVAFLVGNPVALG